MFRIGGFQIFVFTTRIPRSHDGMGVPNLTPPQNDPQGVRIVVCVLNPTQNVLYFVLNRVCILGVSVGHVLGGVRFGGVFVCVVCWGVWWLMCGGWLVLGVFVCGVTVWGSF